jgi:hypothetical protein
MTDDEPDPLYDAAFTAGEHQSYEDRKQGIRRHKPGHVLSEESSAFWDGYEPRSQSWIARHPEGGRA